MKNRYALINEQGEVVNVIKWDGVSQWQPPAGHTVVECDRINIGDTYNHQTKEFSIKERITQEVEEQPAVKTLEERIADLEAKLSI